VLWTAARNSEKALKMGSKCMSRFRGLERADAESRGHVKASEHVENASEEKSRGTFGRQREGCVNPSITLRKSASSSTRRSIFSTECMTVEWCLSLKSRPISG
jgi:hypothetical protein